MMVPSNQNACSSTIRRWFEHLVVVVVALVGARPSTPLLARGRGHPPVATPLSTGCSSQRDRLQLFPSTRCRSPACFLLRPAPTRGPSHGGVGGQEGKGRRAEVKRDEERSRGCLAGGGLAGETAALVEARRMDGERRVGMGL